MSAFEPVKESVMLIITVVVLIFLTLFFYGVLGNYKAGSTVNLDAEEVELVALRVLKCLDNNENLDTCIRTEKYGIMIQFENNKTLYINENLYKKLSGEAGAYIYFLDNKPLISVVLRK